MKGAVASMAGDLIQAAVQWRFPATGDRSCLILRWLNRPLRDAVGPPLRPQQP
jgi:hypothetical protein